MECGEVAANLGGRIPMVSIRRYSRALGIALLALAGSLSALMPAVVASTAGSECCATRPMTDRGCHVASERASTPPTSMRLSRNHAASLACSTSFRECGMDVPNAPASKSERRALERRSSYDRAGLACLLVIPERPTTPPPLRGLLPGASLSEAPLYRLTSRFLR